MNEKQNNLIDNLTNCIKILSVDAIESAKSGHPGMPLGFAQVMTVLATEFLKFQPKHPKWFNRDRLVLSAGHGSALLYSFLYLAGYQEFSLDDLKNFRQLHSKAAGHPERDMHDAIETTTGPLGQGMANAVGMAIAAKKYKAELGKEICDHKIYTIVGDGCLMEGISYEAASVAGHLKLDNLIILFDDNSISIDGKTNITVSEDHLKKFEAMGFNTTRIDGHDTTQIRAALAEAQNSDKPSFIACKTVIGKGALTKEGSEKSHGAPLGEDEIKHLKSQIPFAKGKFYIPEELKLAWEDTSRKSDKEYLAWQENFSKLSEDKKSYLPASVINIPDIESPNKPEATRVSSGKIIEALMGQERKIICGSADLAGSNNLKNQWSRAISAQDFTGNTIHYGVRENAMGAIMNGLALSGFTPIGGTFFVFSDYMRPSIRLSALMGLPVIYVMTHDSIGVGEDGSTHQPIEHLASFRAMPNINIFRPACFTEVKECYEIALKSKSTPSMMGTPSMMVLTRQAVPRIRSGDSGSSVDSGNMSSKGGYIISEANDASNIDITIFASGSEVGLAIEVQEALELQGKSVRICSVPSMELLWAQGDDYLDDLRGNAGMIAAIEAASSLGWHRIIGSKGRFFGMDSFGASAPAKDLYKHFGLNADAIVNGLLRS
ncbi:MAG: transketolase [Rickettsiales bacterium]|nr:MAG: transketolase [Rickettsiales bacterium]